MVGLACGYALAKSGQAVVVLERERRVGTGVSSRNSEVIHAGFYYAPGSLKARLCVTGRRALYAFLARHGVAHKKCGKLLVATDESEIDALEKYARQAEANGVEGMRRLTGAEARNLEPEVHAVAALEFEESGVMDAHGYMDALAGQIEASGSSIAVGSPFKSAAITPEGFRVQVGGSSETNVTTRRLIIASGLSAQECARRVEPYPRSRVPKQYLAKGNYFALSGVRAPFERLVYPLPIPGALGTHYRRDLGGVGRFGPDLEWVEAEDYRVNIDRAASFYHAVRKFWPRLPEGSLQPDYAGIRPKIHGPREPQPDFMIDGPESHGVPGLVCLFGIESPGLTSSLALGDEVTRQLAADQ